MPSDKKEIYVLNLCRKCRDEFRDSVITVPIGTNIDKMECDFCHKMKYCDTYRATIANGG